MDQLVVYGDFTCPLSRMASQLVDALVARGTTVTWRAVRADGRTSCGSRIIGVACVAPGCDDPRHPSFSIPTAAPALETPTVSETRSAPHRFDPSLAIAAFADVDGCEAHRVRAALFRAHWRDHLDLSDRRVVEQIAGRPVRSPAPRALRWQRKWEAFANPGVPLVLLRTGYVFRESAAIDELVRRLDTVSVAARSA